jgi:hypothetical protein
VYDLLVKRKEEVPLKTLVKLARDAACGILHLHSEKVPLCLFVPSGGWLASKLFFKKLTTNGGGLQPGDPPGHRRYSSFSISPPEQRFSA